MRDVKAPVVFYGFVINMKICDLYPLMSEETVIDFFFLKNISEYKKMPFFSEFVEVISCMQK